MRTRYWKSISGVVGEAAAAPMAAAATYERRNAETNVEEEAIDTKERLHLSRATPLPSLASFRALDFSMSAPDGEVGGNTSNPLVLPLVPSNPDPPSSPHVAPPPLPTANPQIVPVVPIATPPPRGGTIDGVFLALSGHTASKPTPGPVQDSLTIQSTAGHVERQSNIGKGKALLRGASSKAAPYAPPSRLNPGKSQMQGYQRRIGGPPPLQPKLAMESKSWAQLFPKMEKNCKNNDLSFIEPSFEDGELVVPSEESDLVEMDNHWRLSLLGYVIGKKPYYKAFIDFLYRVWKPKGSIEVLMRGGAFFVVRFSSEEDMQNVIERGPWLMGGRPIVLRKWHRGMQMELE
ncbi:hypothetical protein QJS04_geneDACA017119 [Acorus gramineus]|uniref:DUF4283 domain-containing protein n=1 Tax=Acorus gramineus TaxID=55184 RepID=A0AAV9AW90_ACOGR|nr:hypothetical protein QJS04_geneDACA017119 [Acorus gramineus]